MAGWIKLAVRSFAVAALVGAAQLGAAQALAVLTWGTVPPPELWRRELMWLLFIFAAAVLGGVAGGRRSVRAIRLAIANRRAIAAAQRHSGLTMHQSGLRAARRRAVAAAKDKTVDKARGFAAGAARVSATLFAALGAAASFGLVWLPARNAFAAADLGTLAKTAGVGIAVGSVISLLSLAASPIAANAGMTIIWIWVFGLTSIGLAIATGRPTQPPRLGVLDAPYLIGPDEWWLGANLMVAVAAVVGLAVAAAARWIGAHRLGVALSGLAGPALLAAGYLLVGPEGESTAGYVASLLAATVGLLTSAATAAAHRGGSASQTAAQTSGPAALSAGPAAAVPLAIESGRPSAPTAGQMDPTYASPEPLYLAPARSAPVKPGRVAAPARTARTVPAATAGPAESPAAYPSTPATARSGAAPATASDPNSIWPGGLPGPYAAPPVPALPRPATGSANRQAAPAPSAPAPATPVQPAGRPAATSTPATAAPKTAATRAAAPAPTRSSSEAVQATSSSPRSSAAAPTASAASKPAASVPAATLSPAAGASPLVAGQPAPATSPPKADQLPKADPTPQAGPKTSAKPGKPARTKRGRNAVDPQPVVAAESVPRTTRPAEVVAAELSPPSPAAGPTVQRTSRRAKRRAAREAERVAAEQVAIAARETRRDRRSPALDKREREHVDWVKHLVSLPNDPTLTSREKVGGEK